MGYCAPTGKEANNWKARKLEEEMQELLHEYILNEN